MIQKFDVSTGEEILSGVGFPGIVPVIGEQSLPIRNLGPDLGENTMEILGGLLKMTLAEIHAASGPQSCGLPGDHPAEAGRHHLESTAVPDALHA